MKILRVVLLLLAGLPALAAAAAETAPFTARELAQGYREGVVIAKPRAAQRAVADAAEAREGLRLRRRWDRLDGMRLLELPPGESPPQAEARLRATGRYEFVQRDTIRAAQAVPNDPDFASRQWPLRNDGSNNGIVGADIGATRAWDVRSEAPEIVVAVIDSGVRYDHADLAANMWTNPREIAGNNRDDDGNGYVDDVHGINAIANNGNPLDDLGHGTHVAGIVGAVGNNGLGVAGVAWKVRLMALKFLRGGTGTSAGRGATSDGIECIDYAIRHGAHIINASYGAAAGPVTQFDPAEREAILRARASGVIFVAAAGNDAANMELLAHYPASYRLENVIAVANSTARDDASISSNFGAGSVELFAPGTEIWSTWYTTATPYALRSGTSMAAPHVAGALALLRAHFPGDTYRQVINRLLRSVDPVPAFRGRVQTGGRLNLDRALRSDDHRPFNDDFAQRSRLAGNNFSVRNVSTGATTESEPAVAGLNGAASLWWEWVPTQSATVRISTAGSAFDTLLGVFSGSALDGLTPVAANDDDAGLPTSRLEFAAEAGRSYQIVVAGKNGGAGLLLLDLGAIAPNDRFASAQIITGRSSVIDSANAQASLEPDEPRVLGFTGGKSLWYRWTAPATGRFQAALRSDGFDPLLAVYTGSALNALTLVDSSDNADPRTAGTTPSTTAIVTIEARAGVTYHLQVDGKATGSTPPSNAPFTLTLNDSIWQGLAGSSVTCAPVIGPDGAVYVGSTDGVFHAFNADGSRRWPAIKLDAAQDTSAAAIGPDGTLYFGAGSTVAGNDARLFAHDSRTGEKKWEIVVGTGYSANNAVAIGADGTIYLRHEAATPSASRLFAFTDLGTSAAVRWSAPIPGSSYASAVTGRDGTIYLGSDDAATRHRFYALNPTDGSVKWSLPTDNAVYTAAAIDGAGNLYYGTLTSGRLYSATSAGASRWVYTGASLGTSSSPALSPDGATVYFAAYDGKLHAVQTADGSARWAFPLGKEARASSPAVDANGVVYIGSYDGLLYAVNPDGTLKRTWSTAGIVRSSPAISGSTLYIGSNDEGVYAFDIGAGAAGPWPQYRHNARRTGRAEVEPFTITAPPLTQTAVLTLPLTLSVTVSGRGPFSYQWLKDGTPVPGASAAAFTIPEVSAGSAGTYRVRVTGPEGTLESQPAVVTVESPVVGRLVNLSVRTTAGTGAQTLTVGFAVAGTGDKPVLLRAIGPALTGFGVEGALANPALRLFSGSSAVAENDDWGTAGGLTAVFSAAGAFALPAGSADAALLRPVPPGSYTMQIAGAGAATGIALAELYDTDATGRSRLVNVSARAHVGTGAGILIAGFTVSGNVPRPVLIRGVGPGLAPFGVAGALANPALTIYRGSAVVADNDDWGGGENLAAAFRAIGAFALPSASSRDSALLVTLTPGSYTAQLTGVTNATGVALVEIYEVP